MPKIKYAFQSMIGIFIINFLFTFSFAAAQSAPNAPNSGISHNVSANWSGYVAEKGNFTSITGTWNVPNVSILGNNPLSADAAWVGIGGVSSTDLIQAGTQTIIENGQAEYKLWYETLPSASKNIDLAINPGDSITVSMAEISTNNWQISFRNNTTGQTYTKTVQYVSGHSSAEWIEEMPMEYSNGTFLPLDNFGTISFNNAQTVNNGIAENINSTSAEPLTMATKGGTLLASPSAISGNGDSFTITRSSNEADIVSPNTSAVRVISIRWSHGSHGAFRIHREILRSLL